MPHLLANHHETHKKTPLEHRANMFLEAIDLEFPKFHMFVGYK